MRSTKKQQKQLERDNRKYPDSLTEIPITIGIIPRGLVKVMRSKRFLCQHYITPNPNIVRLSFCRTSHNGESWSDGITWDELQRLKHEAGYGNCDAVEVFPADDAVVNVANMRHLFVFTDAPLPYVWRS